MRHIKKSHSKNVPPDDLETAIKSEIPETIVKSEVEVKAEFSESSSLSNPEHFGFPFEAYSNILQPETFPGLTPFLESGSEFLPSTSSQGELEDLGSEILEDIGGDEEGLAESLPEPDDDDEEILSESVLSNPDLQRLLEPSEEKNLPLPGFSQTFQPPPPS